jgi:4-amino-4-deoxy-L-arabinose transferase-like glycosyltransferase
MSRAHYITAAAVLHLLLATSVFLIGHFAVFPNLVNPSGIIADDAFVYRKEAISLVEILKGQGVGAWLAAPFQFHVKLYSLSFAIFSPLLGFNNLSAEPLNLVYYLAILYLVFKLGREVFNRRTAILAASVVALWPSFSLLTTQLLRDPLFIIAMLTMVLASVRLLTNTYSWRNGLLTGALGGAAGFLLWIVRKAMWEAVLAIVLLGICLLLARHFRERRLLAGNLAGIALLLGVVVGAPYIAPTPRKIVPVQPPSQERAAIENQPLSPTGEQAANSATAEVEQAKPKLSRLAARIRLLRHRFNKAYENRASSSNIDVDVEFSSLADIAWYLPRAAVIGFFAPFPDMWLAPVDGAGRTRRMLAGVETLSMYLIEVLMIFGLWFERRRLPVWLLFLTAAIGVVALGMVVANIGTLYRMRYAFWIMLIIIGMEGAQVLPRCLRNWRKTPAEPSVNVI